MTDKYYYYYFDEINIIYLIGVNVIKTYVGYSPEKTGYAYAVEIEGYDRGVKNHIPEVHLLCSNKIMQLQTASSNSRSKNCCTTYAA